MKVQAFIPSWNSPKCNAFGVQSALKHHCPTVILDAYDVSFRDQWNEARSRFSGDVMLWAMADVGVHNWDNAYPEMVRLMAKNEVGAWAPELLHPTQLVGKRTEYEPRVFEVANPNLIFVAVKRQLLEAMPTSMHRNGWMYDYLMVVKARKMGLKVLCDSRFYVSHMPGSIYDVVKAQQEAVDWVGSLEPEYQEAVKLLWEEAR